MTAIDSASRWHQWTVKSADDVLLKLIDDVDARMKSEWKRLGREELRPYEALVRPESAWYTLITPLSGLGVTLSLERWGESELRGGRVWFDATAQRSKSNNVPAAWDRVMRFLDEGVVPAAQAVGAEIHVPTTADVFISELPQTTSEQLRGFSNAARKAVPLNSEEAELWRSFVISAFRARVVIDPRPFTDWLVQEGWDRSAALALAGRFYEECLLLARYADEGSAA